jgi:hypothetical protein
MHTAVAELMRDAEPTVAWHGAESPGGQLQAVRVAVQLPEVEAQLLAAGLAVVGAAAASAAAATLVAATWAAADMVAADTANL